MFDIGFAELMLIFIVGLVVLGPQRMPIAIRTVMGWVRTIRGLAHNVQTELAQELKLQELQESIKKAEALNISNLSPELSKTVEELKQSAQKMQDSLNSAKGEIQGLNDQQIADIQQRIEDEHISFIAENGEDIRSMGSSVEQEDTRNYAVNHPEVYLAEERHPELDLPDDLNEQLQAYYPPDDPNETATVPSEQEKNNVS